MSNSSGSLCLKLQIRKATKNLSRDKTVSGTCNLLNLTSQVLVVYL